MKHLLLKLLPLLRLLMHHQHLHHWLRLLLLRLRLKKRLLLRRQLTCLLRCC